MADYTRQGDPWTNDGPPDIDADALTGMEDGIYDAVTHHGYGPVADRPPASLDNKNHLWIASDAPPAVSNGVTWLQGQSPAGASAPGPWIDLPLINGWTAFFAEQTVQYRVEESGATIRFRGLLDGTARTSQYFADFPADLPGGLPGQRDVGLVAFDVATGYALGQLTIATNGEMSTTSVAPCFFFDIALGLD